MNDRAKTSTFDTASTGELSGSSTSHTSKTSPSIAALDKATQTDIDNGLDIESTIPSVHFHQEVVQETSSEEEKLSIGPISTGSIGTKYPPSFNGYKQEAVMEIQSQKSERCSCRNIPSVTDNSDGNNSDPTGGIRASADWGDINKKYKMAYCVDCKSFVQVEKTNVN